MVGAVLGAIVLAGACADSSDDRPAGTTVDSAAPESPRDTTRSPTPGEGPGPPGPDPESAPTEGRPVVCRDGEGPTGPLVISATPEGGLTATTLDGATPVDLDLDAAGDPLPEEHLTALASALAVDARTARIHPPDGPGPHPVLLEFHGYGGDAASMSGWSRLSEEGPAAGYVHIALDGRERTRRWELTLTDPDPAALPASDVAVVDALLDVVLDPLCGDPDEIHAAGLSNGAVFSAVLACHSRHDIAAVGAVAFTTGTAGCTDDRPVPTVAFHGTADVVVPYAGGSATLIRLVLGWDLEPAERAMAAKAELNGCDGVEDEPIGADVVRRTWLDCEAETVFYRIEGGGHGWPGPDQPPSGPARSTATIDATALTIEFFDRN